MRCLKHKAINSGAMALKAEHYQRTMAEWSRIHASPPVQSKDFLEQAAWNRVILDTPLRARSFERDAVMYPLNEDYDYRIYREATFLHCLGGDLRMKVQFMFGLYMSTFFWMSLGPC